MKLDDVRNLWSKLSPQKLGNMAQVTTSYYYSKASGVLMAPRLPFSLAFEPTTSCNLRCPECPSGLRSFSRPTGMLDMGFFKDQINAVKDHLIYLTFYFQGEPYLHKNFLEMVQFASTRKVYTCTSTNGHYLDDANAEATVRSGLDRLIISLDGTTQETYASYRIGGKLEKVLDGARNVVHWKRKLQSTTPHIVFQYLVVKPNEHQLHDARRLAREIGVDDITFKTAQIYDHQDGSPLIPDNDRFSRYARTPDGKYKLKNPMHNQCWKMWHSAVITWDGRVVPCCFDKDATHEMGNLKDKTLREVWSGTPYNEFRRSILKARKQIDICRNCSEGLNVFAVD